MKKFLKLTAFKIILTIIIVLAAFGGNLLYSSSITVIEDKIVEPNLTIRTINFVSNIIFYPARLINNLFITKSFIDNLIINGSQNYIILLFLFSFLLPVILEAYLISCIISTFINRK